MLVSGGSRGLGLALCSELLERGYRVSSFSRSESEAVADLNEMHAGRFCFATADMSNAAELKRVVQHAISHHGDLYGLINNAATAADGILAIQPERDIIQTVRINLEATLLLTRLCLRSMIKTPDRRGTGLHHGGPFSWTRGTSVSPVSSHSFNSYIGAAASQPYRCTRRCSLASHSFGPGSHPRPHRDIRVNC